MPRPVSKTLNRIPPKFDSVHLSTKYYYKIEASEDGKPWQGFSGVSVSMSKLMPIRFSNHVLDKVSGFGGMPYKFRLVESIIKKYRFICCYDADCGHKKKQCLQRFLSDHTTRIISIEHTDLPLRKELQECR